MAAIGPRQMLEEAKAAGLLAGDKTVHVSIRTTEALLSTAKRRTGIQSNTELVEVALAWLALPDPVSRFTIENLGVLGTDHELEF